MLHYARLERLVTDKHSSLMDPYVSYEENEVLWIRTKALHEYIRQAWTEMPEMYTVAFLLWHYCQWQRKKVFIKFGPSGPPVLWASGFRQPKKDIFKILHDLRVTTPNIILTYWDNLHNKNNCHTQLCTERPGFNKHNNIQQNKHNNDNSKFYTTSE